MSRAQVGQAIPSWLFGLAIALCLALPARADPLPDCWALTIKALQHRAVSPHPPYIGYNEYGSITQDERVLLQTNPSVIYRDDGVLRITDNGFSYLTRLADPGPPELGPYGNRRSVWLPVENAGDPGLPLIGSVRARSSLGCANNGIESYKNHATYRLSFASPDRRRPSLRQLWVDTRSSEIWKVIVSSPVPVGLGPDQSDALANFEIELAQIGDYVVVNHITWKYSLHAFAQTSNFFGEYYYTAFTYPKEVPADFFHT